VHTFKIFNSIEKLLIQFFIFHPPKKTFPLVKALYKKKKRPAGFFFAGFLSRTTGLVLVLGVGSRAGMGGKPL